MGNTEVYKRKHAIKGPKMKEIDPWNESGFSVRTSVDVCEHKGSGCEKWKMRKKNSTY